PPMPAVVPPPGLAGLYSSGPAVLPIPDDGLAQLAPVPQAKPASPAVVRVSAESKEPPPSVDKQSAGPQLLLAPAEPAKGQPPGLVIEKRGPDSHNVGQPFRYEIVARNPGSTSLHQVRVVEELPSGARCLSVEPQAEMQGHRLIWELGTIDGGAERKLAVQVQPAAEGEFQSSSTATFSTIPWRMRITKPQLTISKKGPESAQVGDDVTFEIQVTNPGSGP